MLNITVPVVLVLVLFSYTNYRYNKNELETLNRERLQQIQQEVQNLIEIYDYGMKMSELHFEDRMEKISRELVILFDTKYDAATTNLYSLSEEIGLDTTIESIYIIDTNGVVVNTSFYPDLHLDFYARGGGYREYFEKIWAQNNFFADRFSSEQVTGRIKKWSFIPTSDGQYLVELGFLSNEAKIMKETLLEKVNEIATKHEDLERVFLAMQVKGERFEGIEDSVLQQKMQEVLVSKENQRIVTEEKDRTVYEDLFYIEVLLEETSMFSGVILYIKSDDSKERKLIGQAVLRFGIMAGVAILLLILIITFRARTITRPIIRLTQKAEIISSGKLDERIDEEGNNEITQLSRSFNHMVEELQDSYNTLEQKVRDRTAEVVEQKNEAEHQRHLVEEKQKEILDSINYAKRIQNAILPPGHLIKEYLPESFVLYKPKDIVAGDFYWMEKVASTSSATLGSKNIGGTELVENQGAELVENQGAELVEAPAILFAAADCTGHGVPGALVSVVCHNALNRAVREYGITEPGKILDKTREIVIAEFEKSAEEVKDGMDISLCSLVRRSDSEDGHTLNWAGANNPLWIIRKKSESTNEIKTDLSAGTSEKNTNSGEYELREVKTDLSSEISGKTTSASEYELQEVKADLSAETSGKTTSASEYELQEVKADKQPIGKYAEPHPFTTHTIELKKGDTIYIFTDGYADQFGGDRGKKFKASAMKDLFLSVQHLSMEAQKEQISKAFENWKGKLEQIDDVCVIGVKI